MKASLSTIPLFWKSRAGSLLHWSRIRLFRGFAEESFPDPLGRSCRPSICQVAYAIIPLIFAVSEFFTWSWAEFQTRRQKEHIWPLFRIVPRFPRFVSSRGKGIAVPSFAARQRRSSRDIGSRFSRLWRSLESTIKLSRESPSPTQTLQRTIPSGWGAKSSIDVILRNYDCEFI